MKVLAIILCIVLGLIGLAIPCLSIAGIVLGSMDLAHGIVTTKSLCFVIFGCLGILITGGFPAIISMDIDIW